jgi:hypothetical protein
MILTIEMGMWDCHESWWLFLRERTGRSLMKEGKQRKDGELFGNNFGEIE